jgi:archaellum component FlaF (FlaF/FlaG flagellin family)
MKVPHLINKISKNLTTPIDRPVINSAVLRRLLYVVTLALPVAVHAELERVSVSSEGVQANADSYLPALSHEGRYVTFLSAANNLVAGDSNAEQDVFLHDRITGETRRVNVASDGTQANDVSSAISAPAISGDGRYVLFDSAASNLVPDDNNDMWDIFIHDSKAGTTQRVSVTDDGSEPNGFSQFPEISNDGRFVSFVSSADNLVPGDTNGVTDIFVQDLETNTIERVNVASDGTQANAGIRTYWLHYTYTAISANGRYVTFTSLADNLVPGDENGLEDVFVHDRETGTTQRVSVSSTGVEGNEDSILEGMSADGRFILFYSTSSNLTPDGEPGSFLHDRETGETKLSIEHGYYAAISDDGRHLAYLVYDGVLVFDQQTGRTTQVGKTYNGDEANGAFGDTSISGDGKYVGFSSSADNLVPGDSNNSWDVFMVENPHSFTLNPGLNDAWYNANTDGQGFFITVFPDLGKVSMAWLTYDTVLPPADATANLGDPGHRWMTATGKYIDNQAFLNITITSGGVFDTPTEIEHTDPPGSDGAIILTFDNCSSAKIEYDIPSINRLGTIPIKRVARDNIKYCEALNMY